MLGNMAGQKTAPENIGKRKLYLINTNSKKIHRADSGDKRCHLSQMREEYIVYCETLEEALSYPSAEHPLAKKCSFCLTK